MRVITVRQPWAWALIHGGKDVENRVRNIAGNYRGPLAIHAGLTDADNAPESLWLDAMRDRSTTVEPEPGKSHARWQPRGVVIGVVDLADVHDGNECNGGWLCSEWAMVDHWHLCVTDPRPIEPIPATGRLGLWRPDQDLADQIAAALTPRLAVTR